MTIKRKKQSLIGWIAKDGGKMGFDIMGQLSVRGAGIWKKKMAKDDKKVRLTIEEI